MHVVIEFIELYKLGSSIVISLGMIGPMQPVTDQPQSSNFSPEATNHRELLHIDFLRRFWPVYSSRLRISLSCRCRDFQFRPYLSYLHSSLTLFSPAMFRPVSRALLRAPAVARGPASRRLISTAPAEPKSRSWKNTAVRLGLAAGAVYYYNTSDLFAENPSCTLNLPKNSQS